MPSAYLKRRLRSLDEVLGERGLNRTDVGLPPVAINENEPPAPPERGRYSARALVLACCLSLVLGVAIGAGLNAAMQRGGDVASQSGD